VRVAPTLRYVGLDWDWEALDAFIRDYEMYGRLDAGNATVTTMPARGHEMFGNIFIAVNVVLVLIILYWMPSLIAWYRKVGNLGSIIALNFFGFVLGIGWVAALAWALKDVKPANTSPG
jgi:hypothetical protein